MKPLALKTGLSVRYRTALCDAEGRIEQTLAAGRNMITDWGMDRMATDSPTSIAFLHLGSTTETLKRVPLAGNELTVDDAGGASALAVACTSNFFAAADVGRTLQIDGWPELKVTAFTDAQHVTAAIRGAAWPEGFTPDADPHDGDWGVHYTNVATLASQFTRFSSYDTGDPNHAHTLTDGANDAFIVRRVFLSAVVSGSPWTVNQLGWGDSTSTTQVWGKANLSSPDVVPVGKRYRVELEVTFAQASVDLVGVPLDFGALGELTADIRAERIKQTAVLSPFYNGGSGFNYWHTAAFSFVQILLEGETGFSTNPIVSQNRSGGYVNASGNFAKSSYTNGTFERTSTFVWPDTVAWSNATALAHDTFGPGWTIRFTDGTLTKPTGYKIELDWLIRWTRELTN